MKALTLAPSSASISDGKVQPSIVMAITEGRGIAIEVGICVFNTSSCECILYQFADTQSFTRTLHMIYLRDPQKILMPSSSINPIKTQLYQLIELHYPNVSLIVLPRRSFSEDTGLDCIKSFALHEDRATLLLGLNSKYYCLSAISAAFKYVMESEVIVFSEHTILFYYQSAEDTITIKNLELVTNIVDRFSKKTLYGVLNKTVTAMGGRLLRMNMLQPSNSLEIIQDRLNAVEALSEREECLFGIQTSLKQLADLDHTIAFVVKTPSQQRSTPTRLVQYAEAKINHSIKLKTTLKSIKNVIENLPQDIKDGQNRQQNILLWKIHKDEINKIIHPSVNVETTSLGIRNQKCYAIKVYIKNTRQTYKENTEDVYELVSNYSEIYKLPFKVQFSPSKGFFIGISVDSIPTGQQLPDEFLQPVKKRKMIQVTTLELMKKNTHINDSLAEIYLMSDCIVSELLKTFRENINTLYKASEAISLLDMLCSFAFSKIVSDYARPEFTNTLAIRSGRHPILDELMPSSFVPNDTFASLSSTFQFITGLNMSGKSTYLKQIALLNIMAHMGSFVPAEYASFRLADQIMSRLTNDNTISDIGTSSFMTEMTETAYILQNVTDKSLVFMDELGRGTSPIDALGITGAICEALIKTKAFCFFVTHLHELTKSLATYPNVVNLQLKVNSTVIFFFF
ncbi:hypothetical protein K501DRAFT_166658 [Backusella circina FSU 941]|nr:hypothetical protein K501DRAFT_166658 [Backusella circina FSU 941]